MKLEVNPFKLGTDKEAALKPLEEAAEIFGAWQEYEEFWHKLYMVEEDVRWIIEEQLENEIADCITACVNLAERHGLDLQTALERVEDRNRERGAMGTSFFIAKINLDDTQYCDSCPCLYMTEGMYSDCCQLDEAVRDVEQDKRGRVIRPNWCPLLKVTAE